MGTVTPGRKAPCVTCRGDTDEDVKTHLCTQGPNTEHHNCPGSPCNSPGLSFWEAVGGGVVEISELSWQPLHLNLRPRLPPAGTAWNSMTIFF